MSETRLQIYRYEFDGVKCAFCNYRTRQHYILASSEEEAEDEMRHAAGDVEMKGFCAGCLIDEVINDRPTRADDHDEDRPNYELVPVEETTDS